MTIVWCSIVLYAESIFAQPQEEGAAEEEDEPAKGREEDAKVEALLVVDAEGDEDGVEREGTVELAVAVGDTAAVEGEAV